MTSSQIVVSENKQLRPICPPSKILLSNTEDRNRQYTLIEQHWLPAYEQPEVNLEGHIISIHLSDAINFENTMKGKWSSDSLNFQDICITPHKTQFKARWQQSIETIMVCLDVDWLDRIAQENFDREECKLNLKIGIQDLFIYSLVLSLRNEIANDYQGGEMYGKSLLNSLALHLLSKYSTRSPIDNFDFKGLSPVKQKMAIAFIQENFERNLKLVDISQYVGLSEFYFNRQFKESLGVTPHQYLTKYRIDRAKHLLKRKKLKITQIANSCGFASQSYFSKQFRQIVGVTPRVYRQQVSV